MLRKFKVLVVVLLIGMCFSGGGLSTIAGAKEPETLKIGVGYFPYGPLQRSFAHYDEKYHVIAAEAKRYGYNLEVKWLQFPTAPPELAAFKSGDIVIGPMATFPLIVQIEKGEKFQVVSNTLGMYKFMVMVRKGSGIKDFSDLAGKTVGVTVGSAHQSAFENFLLCEFGKSASELGIRYVNQTVPVPVMPKGMDAYVTFIPPILGALEDPNSQIEPLLYLSPAQTGPAYDGYLGKGGGIPIPSAKKSPFYPEGYLSLRTPFVVTERFAKQHPNVVKAFVIAQQKATKEFATWTPSRIADLWPAQAWQVMPRKAFEKESLAEDLLYKYRDWVWPTQALIDIMFKESEQMVGLGVINKALGSAELRSAFDLTAPILKEAYEELGCYPSMDVFTDKTAKDFRGLPVWAVDFDKYER